MRVELSVVLAWLVRIFPRAPIVLGSIGDRSTERFLEVISEDGTERPSMRKHYGHEVPPAIV